jgi:hypothetical protein
VTENGGPSFQAATLRSRSKTMLDARSGVLDTGLFGSARWRRMPALAGGGAVSTRNTGNSMNDNTYQLDSYSILG